MTRAEVQALLQEQMANNSAYKAIQTTLNKTHQKFEQQLAAKDAELAALRGSYTDLETGFNFIGETLLNALPDADRARAEAALKERKVDRLEREIKQMRQPAQHAAPNNSEFEDQMQTILAEAQEALEDAAAAHGIDPKTKGLDYGDTSETFAARLKKLNASVKALVKAKEDADVDSVKQKVAAVPTRQDGGTAIQQTAGKSLLELGADELWNKMQQAASKR